MTKNHGAKRRRRIAAERAGVAYVSAHREQRGAAEAGVGAGVEAAGAAAVGAGVELGDATALGPWVPEWKRSHGLPEHPDRERRLEEWARLFAAGGSLEVSRVRTDLAFADLVLDLRRAYEVVWDDLADVLGPGEPNTVPGVEVRAFPGWVDQGGDGAWAARSVQTGCPDHGVASFGAASFWGDEHVAASAPRAVGVSDDACFEGPVRLTRYALASRPGGRWHRGKPGLATRVEFPDGWSLGLMTHAGLEYDAPAGRAWLAGATPESGVLPSVLLDLHVVDPDRYGLVSETSAGRRRLEVLVAGLWRLRAGLGRVWTMTLDPPQTSPQTSPLNLRGRAPADPWAGIGSPATSNGASTSRAESLVGVAEETMRVRVERLDGQAQERWAVGPSRLAAAIDHVFLGVPEEFDQPGGHPDLDFYREPGLFYAGWTGGDPAHREMASLLHHTLEDAKGRRTYWNAVRLHPGGFAEVLALLAAGWTPQALRAAHRRLLVANAATPEPSPSALVDSYLSAGFCDFDEVYEALTTVHEDTDVDEVTDAEAAHLAAEVQAARRAFAAWDVARADFRATQRSWADFEADALADPDLGGPVGVCDPTQASVDLEDRVAWEHPGWR